MPEPRPAISVVIPAHNAATTLRATLAGLTAQTTTEPFEVIVVDSASTDHTAVVAQQAAATDHRIRVLHNPGGEPAGSRNLGARAAHAPVIAFTDADCVPDPGWLAAGLRAHHHTGADLIQGRVLPAGPHRRYDRTLSVGHESGLYETANLFVTLAAFRRTAGFAPLPGFSEDRPFGEDTWWAWRARRAGARSAFCAEAVVRHAVFPRAEAAFIAEQLRRGYFPALVKAAPELRTQFLHRRVFLSPRTARFDLAVAAAATAALTRRPGPLLAALPYLATRPRPAEVAGDAVGAAALIRGSLAARTLVL